MSYGTPVPPPPPSKPVPSTVGRLASWPQRAGGYILDLLLMLPGYIVFFVGVPKTYTVSTTRGSETSTSSGTDEGITAVWVLGIVLIIGTLAWNRWYKGGTSGQTIGRGVVGIRLVDEAGGQPIGFGKALVRDIAHVLDSITCGFPLGWLWPLWDPKRQTFSDKVMKTSVVTTR